MKERGIIFDAESVRAILAGAKSQSRRAIKPQPPSDCGRILGPEWYEPAVIDRHGEMIPGKPVYGIYDEDGEWGIKCPHQPGDRLYVKEAWAVIDTDPGLTVWYPAGHSYKGETVHLVIQGMGEDEFYKYSSARFDSRIRSPMFMPKWAARIWLEVTAVRVERLQSISFDDVIAEGLDVFALCPGVGRPLTEARALFADRWNAINERRGFPWESNPWVFIYEFRKIAP